jgi:hypothetical protein
MNDAEHTPERPAPSPEQLLVGRIIRYSGDALKSGRAMRARAPAASETERTAYFAELAEAAGALERGFGDIRRIAEGIVKRREAAGCRGAPSAPHRYRAKALKSWQIFVAVTTAVAALATAIVKLIQTKGHHP